MTEGPSEETIYKLAKLAGTSSKPNRTVNATEAMKWPKCSDVFKTEVVEFADNSSLKKTRN